MNYLLHHLLQRGADARPDGLAVLDGDRSATFGELDSRSNQLARQLIEVGIQRGDRVGLYLDKSLESVVGIYGTLKAGAVYVPLDPQAPVSRLSYIAQNCGMRVLITGSEKADQWGGLIGGGAPIETLVVLNATDADVGEIGLGVDVVTTSGLAGQLTTTPAVGTIDLDLAYVLYTSGSTGDPKGVMLSHLNARTFVDWASELCMVGPNDRISSHAPLHFDLSVFDIFAAASGGAPVVLVPQEALVFPAETSRFIDRTGITIWYSVPSALSMMLQRGGLEPGAWPQLRTLLFAGEVFPTKHLRQLMTLIPHARFINLYGPTETNVCTFYEVPALPPDRVEPIPIGIPIDNVEVFVVADDGTTTPPGNVGELCVRGASVMQGYWGDPERTSRAYVRDPRGRETSDLAYRTGDLVRIDPDGNYVLLGRADNQIKSRGYRIELGDIEAALYAHPDVTECAVTAVPDELITNRIKAFVVTHNGVVAADLVRFCAKRIPHYMIPESFEFRDELPKTSTGKVDRRSLSTLPPASSRHRSELRE